MKNKSKVTLIPERNLYYMLTYALGFPMEIDKTNLDKNFTGDFTNLLAKVMVDKLSEQIKRGPAEIFLDDRRKDEDTRTKIVDFETIQKLNSINPSFSYMNDFLNRSNIHTQIIKRTISLFLKYKDLEENYEWELVKIYDYMRGVRYIDIDENIFNGLITHKNNKSYEFVLKICEYIWSEIIYYDEYKKRDQLLNLSKEPEKIELLINKFLKEFYKRESFIKRISDKKINDIDFTEGWESVHAQLKKVIE